MTIDLGTGDGRAVLATANREPGTLALGLDANAAAMAEASRRAARTAGKGGLANARFAVASAESLPPELDGVANAVTVHFPWASLLRGCLGLDTTAAAGIAGLIAPDGSLELLLAPAARDGLDGIPTAVDEVAAAVAQAFAQHALEITVARPATAAELRASGSTWARRLGLTRAGQSGNAAAGRQATLVRLVRR